MLSKYLNILPIRKPQVQANSTWYPPLLRLAIECHYFYVLLKLSLEEGLLPLRKIPLAAINQESNHHLEVDWQG